MTSRTPRWKFAVDRGGTFTDIIGLDPEGKFHVLKLLTQSPDYADASMEGIRRLLGVCDGGPLPGEKIEEIRLGTTAATNALLERKGGRVALLITKGFADLLEISYQNRPDIFSLCVQKAPVLYDIAVEVDERIGCDGAVIRSPDMKELADVCRRLTREGIDSVAVVFVHSWINPLHEILVEEELKRKGIPAVFPSHRASNLIKIVSRGHSAVVDAYLNTVLRSYIEGVRSSVGTIPIHFMQSSGGVSTSDEFTGRQAILSGPAGGVVAVSRLAEETGVRGAIGFDMGGTSTDVCRFDGEFERTYESTIGGVDLQTEMLNVVTVASGGGSVLAFDGRRMTVGPESAGAYPGPACYGFGGPLTITDANLLTGRIVPEYFPKTFGAGRNAPLDSAAAEEKFIRSTAEINAAAGSALTPRQVALGFLKIANEKMATAIREISVSRGFDVRDYALVCFGGAGGQHACAIASLLDIGRIIIHPLCSVMSAYGIGLSRPSWKAVRTVLQIYTADAHEEMSTLFEEMEEEIISARKLEGGRIFIKRTIDIRPKGAEAFLSVDYRDYLLTRRTFSDLYQSHFGFGADDSALEIVNLRVEITKREDFFPSFSGEVKKAQEMPVPECYHDIYYEGAIVSAPLYLRDTLPSNAKLAGPAIIVDNTSTIVIDPGFHAELDGQGLLILTGLTKKLTDSGAAPGRPDPVLLEVFNNLFMGIATEMGLTLKNTAHSVNMKERLDFSCGIFDSDGNLVANAPHIPVHLGSMPDAVKFILTRYKDAMRPGDLYLTNDPFHGGSHLPDMTVVRPVFSGSGDLIFFVAARGHHSDVGGITPGSMPPSASHIDEEGILISGLLLFREGTFREKELRTVLSAHRRPVRNIEERIADFKAQMAACGKGETELQRLITRYGWGTVGAYMRYIQENAEFSVKKMLSRFTVCGAFRSSFEDRLDDGTEIKVKVSISTGDNPPETARAVIDFRGTGGQHRGDNLNAPLSVTKSAVIYVLRTLMDSDIPLNSGCMKPVEILIPQGSLLNPSFPAPVASGNVETSQRLVDVLLGAFGIAAASQGTMNNLLFEVEGETPYYETIAGGAGAADGCPGASGVQVHMTNTRITDPEILEFRHPGVRLERFSLRRGSGGNGRFPGGDGVVREIRFLKEADVSIISERRIYEPYGMKGGGPGKRGKNLLRKNDGTVLKLGHRLTLRVEKDESVIIETPGGGGYGEKF